MFVFACRYLYYCSAINQQKIDLCSTTWICTLQDILILRVWWCNWNHIIHIQILFGNKKKKSSRDWQRRELFGEIDIFYKLFYHSHLIKPLLIALLQYILAQQSTKGRGRWKFQLGYSCCYVSHCYLIHYTPLSLFHSHSLVFLRSNIGLNHDIRLRTTLGSSQNDSNTINETFRNNL
jgi:hypothetical protein